MLLRIEISGKYNLSNKFKITDTQRIRRHLNNNKKKQY